VATRSRSTWLQTGLILGTAAYMSPGRIAWATLGALAASGVLLAVRGGLEHGRAQLWSGPCRT